MPKLHAVLPNTIEVKWVPVDDDQPMLIALEPGEDPMGDEDDVTVGVYELTKIRRLKREITVVSEMPALKLRKKK